MKIVAMVPLLLMIAVGGTACSENGGNGGPNGIPGCDGGTNPSPDGKFYIPGTKQECNPSDADRKKLSVQPG